MTEPAQLNPVLTVAASVCAALLTATATAVGAQQVAAADARDCARGALCEGVLGGVEWRTIGPAVVGGRIADIAVVESDARIIYVGSATGGVWKTTSHGASWTPVFAHQETSSIGDVSIAPSNPDIVWVGTGEPQNRQSSPWGAGVYRSSDAGQTWTHVGLTETRHISRIRIHPTSPNVVYVAAVGHLWGANEERGVYRTRDGGVSWDRVLYVDENTGAIDLVMHPTNPNVLFAAMYQRRRTAFGFNGGGPGSGIYRTRDGGESWTELTNGLPAGDKGRIGLDIYRGDGDLVFAVVQAEGDDQGVYVSQDGGDSWEMRSDQNNRPMYYSQIRVDPSDPDRVYQGGSTMYASSDQGRSFDGTSQGVHPDHHAIWIDPNNSNHVLSGNDGGLAVSFDRGETWRMYDNLPISQFYEIGVDMRDPYYVCGGLQDNGSWCAPNNSLSGQGIRNADWYNIGSGDGFYARIDPTDANIVYGESQNGNLWRQNLATGERMSVRPAERALPPHGMDRDPDEIDNRYNWNTPVHISVHDPASLYFGANVLFKSADRGVSWQQISPDVTMQIDRDTMPIMGRRPIDGDFLSQHDGTSSYGTLTTIGESPLDPDILYTGADDGAVFGTRDGGQTWTNLSANFPGLPAHTYVSRVVASGRSPGAVYVTFDGHYNDDYRAHVFVSDDFGQTFRRIVTGLPDWSVNVIIEHPDNPSLLFLGNEVGVYFSIDGGALWTPLRNNMPTVPVDDIRIHPRDNDLVVGTHGRGVWIMDDITFLERLTPQVLASPATLFPTEPATMANSRGVQAWVPAEFSVDNPPEGALVRYYLGEDLVGTLGADEPSASLTILDGDGQAIRALEGPGTRGLHEVVWNFEIGVDPEDAESDEGPAVLPGSYAVRLTAGGQTAQTQFVVRPDPRFDYDPAMAARKRALAMSGFGLARQIAPAGDALEELIEAVEAAEELLESRESPPTNLVAAVEDALDTLDDVENAFEDVDDGAGAISTGGSWSLPVTEDQIWELERAWQQAPGVVERINELISSEVPALLGRIYQPDAMPTLPDPVPVPSGGG